MGARIEERKEKARKEVRVEKGQKEESQEKEIVFSISQTHMLRSLMFERPQIVFSKL